MNLHSSIHTPFYCSLVVLVSGLKISAQILSSFQLTHLARASVLKWPDLWGFRYKVCVYYTICAPEVLPNKLFFMLFMLISVALRVASFHITHARECNVGKVTWGLLFKRHVADNHRATILFLVGQTSIPSFSLITTEFCLMSPRNWGITGLN